MMLVAATSTAIQKTTGMTPEHATATATGVVTSVAVTAGALAAGAIVQATADGVHDPAALWAWAKDGHLWGYAVAQIVAPVARGFLAHKNSVDHATPPAEGSSPT